MTESELRPIEETLHYLRNKAADYAKAKSNRVHIEQYRKSLKAKLMVEAEREGITAANKQEVFAYAHRDYIDLLDGLQVAVHDETLLAHLMEAGRLRVEIWRTEQANNRVERKGYGA